MNHISNVKVHLKTRSGNVNMVSWMLKNSTADNKYKVEFVVPELC